MWYKSNRDLNNYLMIIAEQVEEDDAIDDPRSTKKLRPDEQNILGVKPRAIPQSEMGRPFSEIEQEDIKKPYQPRVKTPGGSAFNIPQPPALDALAKDWADKILQFLPHKIQQETDDYEEITVEKFEKLLRETVQMLINRSREDAAKRALTQAEIYIKNLMATYGTNINAMQNAIGDVETGGEDNFANLSENDKKQKIKEIVSLAVRARQGSQQNIYRGKAIEPMVIQELLLRPEFSEYTEKGKILKKLYESGEIGQHAQVSPSGITPEWRENIGNLIDEVYYRSLDKKLRELRTQEQTEENKKNIKDLVNLQKERFDLLTGAAYIDRSGEIKKTPSGTSSTSTSADFDRILKDKLLNPVKNKEQILTFFAPTNRICPVDWQSSEMKPFWEKLINHIKEKEQQSDGNEEFMTSSNASKIEIEQRTEAASHKFLHANVANYLQNPLRIDFFMRELEYIIKNQNPQDINPNTGRPYAINYNYLHYQFIDWISNFLSRHTYSEHMRSIRDTTAKDGEGKGFTIEQMSDTARVNRGALEKIDAGLLHSCEQIPEITTSENLEYLDAATECLKDEWSKIKTYGEKVIAKIKDTLEVKIQSQSKLPAKEKTDVANLLRKAYFWERMLRGTHIAVNSIVTGKAERTEQSAVSVHSSKWHDYVNRNWRKVFQDTFFEIDSVQLPKTGGEKIQDDVLDFGDQGEVSSPQSWGQQQTLQMCEYYVKAGFASDLQQAHADLIGKNASQFMPPPLSESGKRLEYTGNVEVQTDKGPKLQPAYRLPNSVKQIFKTYARDNFSSVSNILLDKEILNSPEFEGKGTQTALSFLSLIGYDTTNAKLGLMFSKSSIASFKEKSAYLTQIISKGSYGGLNMPFMQSIEPRLDAVRKQIIENSDDPNSEETRAEAEAYADKEKAKIIAEEISKLSPNQLNTIFDTIRTILPVVYGSPDEAKKCLLKDNFVDNKILTESIEEAKKTNTEIDFSILDTIKIGNEYDIKEYRKLISQPNKRQNASVYNSIAVAFANLLRQGYFMEEATEHSVFIKLLARELKSIYSKLQNPTEENAQWFENWRSHTKITSPQTFLGIIGVRKVDDIPQYLNNLSALQTASISKRFAPKLHRLRATHQLTHKIDVEDESNMSMHDICRILISKLNPKTEELVGRAVDISTANVFAQLLDLLPTEKIAAVNIFNLQKFARTISR